VANAASHNGGITQFNMGSVGYAGCFEFMNILKSSQRWSYVSGSLSVDPADCLFDSNNYPRAIPGGTNGLARKTYMTTQSERPGNWVVTWDGGGTIFVDGGSTVSGSKTSANGTSNNRYEFSMSGSPTTDFLRYGVASVVSNTEYIKNMKVYHIDDEAAIHSGSIFGTKFLEKLREANPGVIRFLGWIGSEGNGTNDVAITTWA
jgi:hypothetical protein